MLLPKIGEGRTAEVYDYGGGRILKLYRKDLPKSEIEAEYEISRYAHAEQVLTPEPAEMIRVEDRWGIVFQRVHGTTMLRRMTSKPWLVDRESKKLAELHVHLHKRSAGDMRRKQKDALRGSILEAPLLDDGEKERILRYLDELPEGHKLCHGDFHPDNVLIGKDGRWIIDWMTGMSGHPAGDAARTVLMLQMGTMPEGTPALVAKLVELLRKRITAVYLRQYCRLSELDGKDIEQWLLPVAAARLVEWIPPQEKKALVRLIRGKLEAVPGRS